MRTTIPPPDFVTRFGFLLLCQFDFANSSFNLNYSKKSSSIFLI